jgi:hypothetical protein
VLDSFALPRVGSTPTRFRHLFPVICLQAANTSTSKRYLDIISGVLAGARWNRGCLIGDFSLETTTQTKLLRQRLEAIFQEWRAPFASCIAEAQTIGEIDSTFDPMDLAE